MKHVVAVAAVILRGSRMLAMRRASHKVGAGLWETVSGRVEIGEDPRHAMLREIAEETGLSVDLDPRPVDAYVGKRGTEPMLVVVYRARSEGQQVIMSNEHSELAWLTPEEFRERSTLTRLADAIDRAFE